MKSLILLTAFVSAQAFAGTIICSRQTRGSNLEVKTAQDADKPEVLDFLRVEGLIDSEGFLEVRRDLPTMATVISKPNNIDICRGVNISQKPEDSGGNAQKGWRTSKLDSAALRIRLHRNQDTNEITATTVTDDTKIIFRDCEFIAEEGDQEALKELWDQTHDPELDAKMEEDKAKATALPEPGIINKTLIYLNNTLTSQGTK